MKQIAIACMGFSTGILLARGTWVPAILLIVATVIVVTKLREV